MKLEMVQERSGCFGGVSSVHSACATSLFLRVSSVQPPLSVSPAPRGPTPQPWTPTRPPPEGRVSDAARLGPCDGAARLKKRDTLLRSDDVSVCGPRATFPRSRRGEYSDRVTTTWFTPSEHVGRERSKKCRGVKNPPLCHRA